MTQELAKYEIDLDRERPDLIYLRGLAKSTQATQSSALKLIAENILDIPIERMDWTSIDPKTIRLIKRDLLEVYKRSTAKRMLMSVMAVLRVARINKMIDPDVYENIQLEIRSDPIRVGNGDEYGNVLDHGELKLLLDVANVRDRAALCCMCPGGMRRIEARRLDIADILEDDTIFVRGKTADRKVQMVDGMKRFIDSWLEELGEDEGPLFPNPSGDRLSDRGFDKLIAKNAKLAGIGKLASHDLRRTTITMLLEAGTDPLTVARHVGHRDPAMTMRYDRRSSEERLKWLEKTFSFLS